MPGLDHRTKIFGVREARIVQLLTDVAGAAATYSQVSSTVQAAPAPTTTTFSVAAGLGASFVVGRAITVGTNSPVVIQSIATDALTVSPALPSAPSSGAAVTMTTGYPLTGAKALALTDTMKSVDLRGDNTFLDTDTVLQGLEVEVDLAKISLDVMALMLGGTIVDSGVTPNRQSLWSLLTQPVFSYFRLEARCFSVDQPAGDLHLIFNKAKAASTPLFGLAEEDYHYPKIKCKVVPPIGTTPWLQVVYNETAAAIA